MRVLMTVVGAILVAAIPLGCGQDATVTGADEAVDNLPAGSAVALVPEGDMPPPVAPAEEIADPSPETSPPELPPPELPPETSEVAVTVQKPIPPLSATVPSTMAATGAIAIQGCLVSLIEEAQVPAQVPAIEGGMLSEIFFKEGDPVKQGDVLAQVDDRRAQLQFEAANAKLQVSKKKAESDIGVRYATEAAKVAKAVYDVAAATNRKIPRTISQIEIRKLWLDWSRAVLEIEQAELQEDIDDLEVKVSEAELKAAEENIRRYKIISPLDAVVRKRYMHRGEWVKPGDPVMHIVRVDKLRVEGFLDIAQYDPSQIRGKPVEVTVNFARGALKFSGQVTFVDPEVQSGGDYPVWPRYRTCRTPPVNTC